MEDKSTNTEKPIKKYKRAEPLRPFMFKPGQSGNPKGRPPGTKSMKERAAEYLKNLNDEEATQFLNEVGAKTVWAMAEGNPTNELTGKNGEPLFNKEDKRAGRSAIKKFLSKQGGNTLPESESGKLTSTS